MISKMFSSMVEVLFEPVADHGLAEMPEGRIAEVVQKESGVLCCGVLLSSDAPEIESDKSFPFLRTVCLRDISQIAQNALHKIKQLFRKKSCYSACAHV